MNNSRRSERHLVLTPAMISFEDSRIYCAVRDVSVGGARLEVDSEVGIPDTFDLLIDAEAGKQRCHVVWRKKAQIGVAFS